MNVLLIIENVSKYVGNYHCRCHSGYELVVDPISYVGE